MLKPYTQNKTASIAAMGAIPIHWDESRMKRYYVEVDDRSQSGDEEMLSVSHKTGVTPRSQKNVTMFMSESNVGQKLCEPGDLVINTMWAWMAALGVSAYAGIVSPSYGVYRPRGQDYSPEYLDYLLRTEVYRAEYVRCSTGIRNSRLRLYPDKFLAIRFLCPPRVEQDQIVRYLDWKVSQINRLLNSKKKQIELFQEQKRAVINASVTRGGIGWKTIKLKYICSVRTGEQLNNEYMTSDGAYPVYNGGMSCSGFYSDYNVDENTIIISQGGASAGFVNFIDVPFWASAHCYAISNISPEVDKMYLFHYLKGTQHLLLDLKTGVGIPGLGQDKLKNYKVSVPSFTEQQAIVAELNSKCSAIDTLTAKITSEISLLHEYRTRLIADVVTGRLDVRDAIIPDYEAIEDTTDSEEVESEDEVQEDE